MTSTRGAPGADFLQLDAGTAPRRGLVDWLAAAIRAAIVEGRLAPGARLPPSRPLAGELGVSRGAVVEAYRRLIDEGLVAARTGAGTVVVAAPSASSAGSAVAHPPGPVGGQPLPAPRAGAALGHGDPWSGPALRAPVLPRDAGTVAATSGAIVDLDLSPGMPDLSAFPRAAWLRAERAVLNRAVPADLGYGDPRGHRTLRVALAGWLGRTRGVRADPDEIIVVSGVAQSLALLAFVLHARGIREIAVEDPGSAGARDELAHWGLDPRPVAVDGHGVDVGQLADSGLPAVVLTPAHQFPTGVVLAPDRRRALLDWTAGGGLVIEDDYDAEHRYDRPPVPALQASAPEAVAHTGSTSKSLAPALRLGWLIAPRRLRADLVAAKHASDIASPAVPQLVLAALITGGELDRHLRRVRIRQRARRDALLAALRTHLPEATVHGVAAGLHLLVTLPEATAGGGGDDVELADAILRAGVLVHPLSWHRIRRGPPGLILGYATQPPDRLDEAARRIARALRTL